MTGFLIVLGMVAWAVVVLVLGLVCVLTVLDALGDAFAYAVAMVLALVAVAAGYGWFSVANHLWHWFSSAGRPAP